MPIENKKQTVNNIFCNTGCDIGKKFMGVLLGILVVYFIFLIGTMIRNNLQEYNYIGLADRMERTITVDAEGKVTATPDIAVTTMGMISEAETVADAQEKNSQVMNSLFEELDKLGIAKEDLQTSDYNIYPRYNYLEEEGRVLQGYEVRQNVKIKIRNLDKASQVLGLAGMTGVNSVSGLEFTIDDDEVYKKQAREVALEKVEEKLEVLKNTLGLKVIGIVSYDEYESGNSGVPKYAMYEDATYGLGGGAPEIESGNMEVVMNVAVTFEIR